MHHSVLSDLPGQSQCRSRIRSGALTSTRKLKRLSTHYVAPKTRNWPPPQTHLEQLDARHLNGLAARPNASLASY